MKTFHGTKRLSGWKSREGTVMVEAAMVYPLVILLILLMVYLSLEFYLQACFTGEVHQRLKAQSAESTGTIITSSGEPRRNRETIKNGDMAEEIRREGVGAASSLHIVQKQKTGGIWLLKQKAEFCRESSVGLQDEARLLWDTRLVMDGIRALREKGNAKKAGEA